MLRLLTGLLAVLFLFIRPADAAMVTVNQTTVNFDQVMVARFKYHGTFSGGPQLTLYGQDVEQHFSIGGA